jgi:hypothetical protein
MRTLAVDADRPDVFVGKVSIAAEGAGEAGRSITQIREGSGCVVGVSDDISSALKEQRTAGDSSGIGDMTEVLGGADELPLPVIALALAAALLFADGWIVYSAPLLFAELLVDGVLAASLYRRLAGAEPRHWLETAFRRTVWPFAATALLFCIAGATMHHLAPEARSIGNVKQDWTAK